MVEGEGQSLRSDTKVSVIGAVCGTPSLCRHCRFRGSSKKSRWESEDRLPGPGATGPHDRGGPARGREALEVVAWDTGQEAQLRRLPEHSLCWLRPRLRFPVTCLPFQWRKLQDHENLSVGCLARKGLHWETQRQQNSRAAAGGELRDRSGPRVAMRVRILTARRIPRDAENQPRSCAASLAACSTVLLQGVPRKPGRRGRAWVPLRREARLLVPGPASVSLLSRTLSSTTPSRRRGSWSVETWKRPSRRWIRFLKVTPLGDSGREVVRSPSGAGA